MMDVSRDFERMRDYVMGRLAEEERRTFEDRLERDPELVREFEQALLLQEGLRQLKTQGYFERSAAGADRGSRDRTRTRSPRLWVPALAAAAVAGLALFLWVQPRPASPGILRASLGTSVAAAAQPVTFTFVSTRGGPPPDLQLPPQGLIELRVQPATHATVSRFRVTLMRGEEGVPATSLGTLTGLAPDADGFVHSYVDSARLTSGSYSLQVAPDAGAGGAPETFAFRLRASGAEPAH
jgi:hypothetical protein